MGIFLCVHHRAYGGVCVLCVSVCIERERERERYIRVVLFIVRTLSSHGNEVQLMKNTKPKRNFNDFLLQWSLCVTERERRKKWLTTTDLIMNSLQSLFTRQIPYIPFPAGSYIIILVGTSGENMHFYYRYITINYKGVVSKINYFRTYVMYKEIRLTVELWTGARFLPLQF